MDNSMTRQAIAGVAALIGAYLLYVSADPASSFGTAFVGFWIGVILFVAVAWLLLRYYHPAPRSLISTR